MIACHQLTPELARDLSEASLVIFVDASTDGRPGSIDVRRLGSGRGSGAGSRAEAGGAARGGEPGPTSHHVGIGSLVALARGLYGAAPEIVVVSVGVASLETGEELSPAVAAALPGVADAVAALLAGRPPG